LQVFHRCRADVEIEEPNPYLQQAAQTPRGENVVDLMDALRKSIGGGAAASTEAPKKPAKKARKAVAGQKEMLMPIAGKKPAKEAVAKKPAAKPQRKSA
jgi:DNA end-binding protein Ku